MKARKPSQSAKPFKANLGKNTQFASIVRIVTNGAPGNQVGWLGKRSRNAMTATAPHSLQLTPRHASTTSMTLDAPTAFAAIALAAVSWDGVLSMAGSRALRHSLDYRHPFCDYGDAGMVRMMDLLLREMRNKGAQHLMVEAAEALNPRQRATAYAVAAEIMRSDGPLLPDEQNILTNLASTLDLPEAETRMVLSVMDVLHADVIAV